MTYNAIDNSSDVADVGRARDRAPCSPQAAVERRGHGRIAGEARLITIKASYQGMFTDFELAAAIAYAVDNGAKIVNLSLGGTKSSLTEVRALEYALTKDVLSSPPPATRRWRETPSSTPPLTLQPLEVERRARLGSRWALRRSPARAPTSRTTAPYISLAAPGEEVFGAISKDSSPEAVPPRHRFPARPRGCMATAAGRSPRRRSRRGRAGLGREPRAQLRQVVSGHPQADGVGRRRLEPGARLGVINVAAAVEVAAVTRRLLQAVKFGDAAQLNWRGSTRKEKAYRVLALGANDEEHVVVPSTTERSHTVQGDKGVTYAFVVESLDAAGAVIARSAPALVTLGDAKSALT